VLLVNIGFDAKAETSVDF